MQYLEVMTDRNRKVKQVVGNDSGDYQQLIKEFLFTVGIDALAKDEWRLVAVVQTTESDGYLFYFERKAEGLV